MANDDIQGTITDGSGTAVSGATVYLFKQSSPSAIEVTTTDANGDYIFNGHPDGDGTTQTWYVTAYYDDGTTLYNTLSKPGVTASLSPAIPDSGIARYEYEQNLTDSWNSNDLTGTGGISYTTNNQYGNYAAVFDGVDDMATAPFNFDASEDFSVVGFLYFESFTGDFDPIFAQRDEFSSMDWVLYYDDRSDKNEFVLGIGESLAFKGQSGVSQSTGSWVHLGLTKGGDTWTLYKDASNVYQPTTSQGWTTSDDLHIGAWQSASSGANIRADRVEFHNKELTATEVSNHYNTGSING